MEPKFKFILVVDDDLSLKPLWKAIFSRHSRLAQIKWVVSAEEGRRLVRSTSEAGNNCFDLVIADLFLAGSETGLDFLRCPEVLALGAKTILTSSAEQANLEVLCQQRLPGAKVIAKPLNVVKCERLLRDWLGSQEAI